MTGAKKIVVFAVAMLLAAGCRGPKIIPDRELAQIFHDIYLVNSYVGQNNIRLDSLNIYEPVFSSYGYTSEDIQYTIGNFAKRKSARLSDDVVEVASQMLRAESRLYHRRIEISDSVALVARKTFAEQIYFDSLIRVRRVADTSRLRITIEDIRPGTYEVSYGYFLDSLDRNTPLRTGIWLVDSTGRQSSASQQRLDRGVQRRVQTTVTATDGHRRLVVLLNGYPRGMTTPNLTIDSLSVTYYLPEGIAVRKLRRSWYGGGTGMLDSLFVPLPENHETHLVPPLVDAPGARIR